MKTSEKSLKRCWSLCRSDLRNCRSNCLLMKRRSVRSQKPGTIRFTERARCAGKSAPDSRTLFPKESSTAASKRVNPLSALLTRESTALNQKSLLTRLRDRNNTENSPGTSDCSFFSVGILLEKRIFLKHRKAGKSADDAGFPAFFLIRAIL